MPRIKVAFIKFAGLAAGGTEKYLQSLAANLSKDRFEVDFFYCDASPYVNSDFKHIDTDPERFRYMNDHGINLIKFKVGRKDVTKPTHNWLDTDFWQFFDENKYDVIISGRAGHREYPFYLIKKTPIIDTLHLNAGADNQSNIKKVIHLSEWHAKKWIGTGGDRRKVEIVCQPLKIEDFVQEDLRSKYNIGGKFIFGFHQRDDDDIFSPIPLLAFSQIESDSNHFVILNGSKKYRQQAQQLGLKNVTFLPFAKTLGEIYNFLRMLDVYAHGRRDGETSGAAIAEAMAFGKPIISHFTRYNNGQLETIGPAGSMVYKVDQYVEEMKKLQTDHQYYDKLSVLAEKRFFERYSFDRQIARVEDIVTVVVNEKLEYNPYHWSVVIGYIYGIKFKIRCRLASLVKFFLRAAGYKY